MSLHDYIEKLRAKPVRERERIAVIWTAIGFAVIFLIWIVSFKEMNKPSEQPVDQTSASLNDLKNNFQDGKDSIQNMMQQLPSQAGPAGTDNSAGASGLGTDNSAVNAMPAPSADGNLQNPGDMTNQNDSAQNIDNNPSAGNNSDPGATNNSPPASSGNADQKNGGVPQLP